MSLSERSISQVAEVNQTSSHYSSIANKGAKCLSNTKAYNPSKGQYTAPEVSADDALSQLRQNADGILYGFRADDRETWLKDAAKTAVKSAQAYIKKSRHTAWAWWQVFEALLDTELEVSAWTGNCSLGGDRDYAYTPGQLVTKVERILNIPFTGSSLDRNRWFDDFTKDKQFNPAAEYLAGLVREDLGKHGPLYTPAERWLRGIRKDAWEPSQADKDYFDSLASTLFGVDDALSQTLLSKWLIGAIARGLEPGCKNDCALVLKGKQGIGKTTALSALFEGMFRTMHAHQKTDNQIRISQLAWCLELGEIESTFRVKDISALKGWMSEPADDLVKKYKEDVTTIPRHWVFAGTTNQDGFLNDPTGSRRFWIIDAGDRPIPVDEIRENRDRIFRVALWRYLRGERHWLSEDENELSEVRNKAYAADNPVVDRLEDILDRLILPEGFDYWGITPDTARALSGLSTGSLATPKQVKAAMTALGYEKDKNKKTLVTADGPKRMRAYTPMNATGKGHELTTTHVEAMTDSERRVLQPAAIASYR